MYVQNCQESYKVQACCEKNMFIAVFIKVIIKEGVRAKEGLVCLSSKFSLLKPNNLVSMTRIFACVLFEKLVSKAMYILNIRYYITEKDKLVLSHESMWFITPMKVTKYYIIDLNNYIPCNESIQVAPIELTHTLN